MEYKQQYKNALEKARELLSCCIDDRDRRTKIYRVEDIESIFPELNESYGEKTRKAIISGMIALKSNQNMKTFAAIPIDDCIAWLEKQVEKKPHEWHSEDEQNLNATLSYIDDEYLRRWLKDIIHAKYEQCGGCVNDKGCVTCVDGNMKEQKVEPKFKVGDWITDGEKVWKIGYIEDDMYIEHRGTISAGGIIKNIDKHYHLWTIADAKDGDVLVNGSNIFIFHFLNGTRLMGYCHVNIDDERFYGDLGKNECFCLIDAEVTPATKEQRDLLFQKMKDVGYEWDAEKKELSEQTLKITPKFCVGQLITDNNGTWYNITDIKCLDDWYYEVYDVGDDNTYLELCSIIDEKFRKMRFVSEIKKMLGN